jgi:hypothetical protein
VVAAGERLLEDQCYEGRAIVFQQELERWGGPGSATASFRETFAPDAPR